jgi:hypothetical protein
MSFLPLFDSLFTSANLACIDWKLFAYRSCVVPFAVPRPRFSDDHLMVEEAPGCDLRGESFAFDIWSFPSPVLPNSFQVFTAACPES